MPKSFTSNPRKITAKRLDHLKDTLARLGDLSGIVHNLETDEIIGGNQRMRIFSEKSTIVMVEELKEPDAQGTVGWGFVVWEGRKYGYRQVRWDAETAAEANIAANLGAGEWDWDVLANAWDPGKLRSWGMDEDRFQEWRVDAGAMGEMIAAVNEEAAFGQLSQADRARFQQMTFLVSDAQADTVRRAMEKANTKGAYNQAENQNPNGNAIARICEEFLGG